jgi:NAD(P)H-dependent FMN reductase
MKVMVLLGSVRKGRVGENIAKWAVEEISKEDGFEAELTDVGKLDLPFYDEPIGGPSSIASSGQDYTNPKGREWADKVASADAFILVTPEYNHGYPASLKNALDWVGPEWNAKPVSFIGYGWSANGSRAVEQLRQVVAELGLVQTRFALNINLGGELGDDGRPNNEKHTGTLHSILGQMTALTKPSYTSPAKRGYPANVPA